MWHTYKVNCKDFAKTYIGQMKQCICKKVANQINDCRNTNIINRIMALCNYLFTTGHTFDFCNVKILSTEISLQNTFSRKINIVQNKNKINSRTDIGHASKIDYKLFFADYDIYFIRLCTGEYFFNIM